MRAAAARRRISQYRRCAPDQCETGERMEAARQERLSSPPPLIGSTGYALRRKSAARTRLRNCSGVLGGVSIGGVGAGGGFTAAGAAAFAAFFAALRAASRASCLAAMSFASAPTGSAGAPSRVMRWSWRKDGLAVGRRHFPMAKHAERVGMRPAHHCGDFAGGGDRQRANVLIFDRKRERPPFPEHRELLRGLLVAAITLDQILGCHACPQTEPTR